jgi:hypothetical protein
LKRLLIVGALAAASAIPFTWAASAATQGACVPNPAGTVCAQGDPAAQTGGVYADGSNTGPGPHGYVGVNDSEGVVGCWSGDYNGSTDNVITPIPPAAAAPAPPAAGPCTPAAP